MTTVLVIEDEEVVLTVSRAVLEKLGFHVLDAKTGSEALEIVESYDGEIKLALLDIGLPDMSGDKLYPRLKEYRPNIKVIVCSGYSIDGPVQKILDAGAEGFMQKPYSLESLSRKLKEVFGS